MHDVSHRDGVVDIGTPPPCEIHTVYAWRIAEGGTSQVSGLVLTKYGDLVKEQGGRGALASLEGPPPVLLKIASSSIDEAPPPVVCAPLPVR